MEYDLFDFLTDYKNNDISKEKALDLITKLFVEQSPVFNKLYKALGWQGGTIHQALDEIQRLKNIESCYKREHGVKVMWTDLGDEEIISDYCFDTVEEAEKYCESCEYEYTDWDWEGSQFTKYQFYDSKSKETYRSYRVLPF